MKEIKDNGELADFWVTANTMYTCIIFIVDYRLLITTKYHTWVNWVIILITSYGAYVCYFCISSLFSFSKSINVLYSIVTYPQFYLIVFLVMHMGFIYDAVRNFFHVNFDFDTVIPPS